ncbi:MAG: pilin [Patescibacteria group bacterium]|jgi:hypothetical protein
MISRRRTIIAGIISLLWLGVVALPVQAASCNTGRILPACACTGDCSVNDFIIMFINIAQLLMSLVGLLALLYFVAGGFDWITSGGSSEKVTSGRSKMINAVIGLVIVIAAWAIMNTVYYVFTGSNTVFGAKWFELKALDDMNPPTSTPPTGFGTGNCDPATLASDSRYGNPKVPAGDSPEVAQLKTCILANVDNDMIDMSQIYTYEVGNDSESNALCNYTRGDESNPCTPKCAHMPYSCHYGGHNGTTGAMGIDFNVKAPYTESDLFNAIKAAADSGGPCWNFRSYLADEFNHTHLSAINCDSSAF